MGPAAAYYSVENGQSLLPDEAMAEAENPDQDLTQFLHTTHQAAADLRDWAGSAWTTRAGGRNTDTAPSVGEMTVNASGNADRVRRGDVVAADRSEGRVRGTDVP